ncbi:hypothetical protein FI667_g5254, partial [Globisporangium splendens]
MASVSPSKALYAGAQCGFRYGNLYYEVPLASAFLLVLVVLGLRVTERATTMLCFLESRTNCDFFAFPRQFVSSERVSGVLNSFIGTWAGDTSTKGFPIRTLAGRGRRRKQLVMLENIFIDVAVLLELVMWFQIAVIAFLPVVPWSTTSQSIAKLKDAPAEDLCSMALRLHSEWAALPLMIALLLPFECLFVGYGLKGFVFVLPVPESSCFTLLQGSQVALSIVTALLYWLLSCMIVFQLNCESSHPVPTLWSDIRYMAVMQATKLPLAMVRLPVLGKSTRMEETLMMAFSLFVATCFLQSVVAFMNANAYLLCGSCIAVAAGFGFTNAWMRPCAHSLVNGLRGYGSVLAAWSGIMGFVAAVLDNPTNKITYEIWSLGAMGLSGASLSALLLYHTEDFWFRLGVLTPLKQDSNSLNGSAAALAPDAIDDEEGTDKSLVHKIKAFFPFGRAENTLKQPRGDAHVAAAATLEVQNGGEDKTTEPTAGSLVSKLALLRHAKAQKRSASSRSLQ